LPSPTQHDKFQLLDVGVFGLFKKVRREVLTDDKLKNPKEDSTLRRGFHAC
jgi:hypothetical protein